MQLPRIDFISHPYQQQLHLRNRHPQPPRQHRHTPALQPTQTILFRPLPQQLHLVILRPTSKWPSVNSLHDIFKANLVHPILVLMALRKTLAQLRRAVYNQIHPPFELRSVERIIVTTEGEAEILHFEIPTGC